MESTTLQELQLFKCRGAEVARSSWEITGERNLNDLFHSGVNSFSAFANDHQLYYSNKNL